MNTHRDSTFAQLKWAQEKLCVAPLWQNTVSPMEMTYKPTGQKIIFRGFDDVLKLASTTVSRGYLCFVWIEEAYEIEREEDFEKLDLSVPRGSVPPPLFKQTTVTFNPWSEKHWLKSRFFDNPPCDAGIYSTNYLCNEFLDDADKAVFENMKKQSPARYRVAGLGEWGSAQGLVYENFEKGKIDMSADGKHFKSFFGLDYGYTNDPTAFIAFKADPVGKRIYIFDEFYRTRMLNCDIANEIIRRGYAKERIRADCAEPKSNDDLRRLGISRITPSVKGRDSILNGIAKISEYEITVDPSCVNTIRELSSYAYDTRTRENGLIMPKDSDNHLMDALRYAFEDVKYFNPSAASASRKISVSDSGIGGGDFNGGWNG